MSQYPGGQPPQDPYYGQPPSDPYFGQAPADPYAAPPPPPPNGPWYGQPPADPYAQQAQYQAWYAQQQAAWPPPPPAAPAPASTRSGGAGAAIAGIFLVLLGVWFLFRDEIAIDIGRVWPVAAVALGILMVIAAFIPRRGS
jgi:hypothetical protein